MENRLTGRDTERLFIAVKLPEEPAGLLGQEAAALSSRLKFAKWTYPDDYHITLQFLGDTPAAKIPELLAALEVISAGQEPFTLRLGEWGTFGAPESPRVLWAGVSGELEQLRNLQRKIVSATSPLGFKEEKRTYSPHLTLARKYRDERAFSSGLLSDLRSRTENIENNCSVKDWTIDAFVVYATRMHAIPMYEMIGKMTFF
ncbi:hypothetical protein R70723_04750 [Paenibacillus sp. FSL R7-0273]|uniref:RNA 2',3'-cyclic phosphodiesterase n=1 Tax=Paenibacillus sp. FSL R7-0273 TaxID=1536772 RepID=UPI0004F86967|nr:RNA 2',3'-cyclic phosphodiesterase [Paenibacillus sp. FSL R7-0273]AIQ45280.1 hypothetical protein R70723_04750 [Paenibacillus sp. FSL R7-0273]OMF88937.1 2'-5' RNA ligase [Paenibacillus sp. FSL R7-0273]